MPIARQAGLYFLSVPSLETLCSVTLEVPDLQNAAGSPYQPHVIRCRELVFTEPDILASPLLNDDRQILIVMQQSFFKSGRLQARLQKIGIKMQKPKRVTPADFQMCLNYTILAKISPAWNKAGELLIEGRDFVSSDQKHNAINMELNVSETQTYMNLVSHMIKMPPIRPHDLEVSPAVLHEFQSQNPHGTIPEHSIYNQWCHILPSLKKGQVTSVSHSLPGNGPFRSYKDMKRYWKNTYGYRLPETEENLQFFEIYFKLIGDRLFTYPSCCVRPRKPTYFPVLDGRAVVEGFLQTLRAKVTALCGVKLIVETCAKYPDPHLGIISGTETVNTGHNLTSNPRKSNPTYQTHRPEVLCHRVSDVSRDAGLGSNQTWRAIESEVQQQIPQAVINSSIPLPSDNDPDVIGPSQPSQKIVPMFGAIKRQTHIRESLHLKTQTDSQKVVPIFKPSLPKRASTPEVHHPTRDPNHNLFGTTKSDSTSVMGPCQSNLVRPCFSVSKAPAGARTSASRPPPSQSQRQQRSPEAALQTPALGRVRLPQSNDTSAPPNRVQSGKGPCKSPGTRTLTPANKLSLSAQRRSIPALSSQGTMAPPHSQTGGHPELALSATPRPWTESDPQYDSGFASGWTPTASPRLPSTPISNVLAVSSKRNLMDVAGNTPAKKPRARPQIQEGLDVDTLLRSNQAGKVNTATLISWLKQRGVPCKVKDKKGDLIQKALCFINMMRTEH